MSGEEVDWIDTAGRTRDQVAAALIAAYRPMVEELGAALGESPEAWRGATLMAMMLAAMMDVAAEHDSNDLRSLLAGLGTIVHSMLEEPLAKDAARRMLPEGER